MTADSSTADRGAIDENLRSVAARRYAILAEIDLGQILACRHHCEEDIDAAEIAGLVDELRAPLRQWLRLGFRAVPEADIIALLEQQFRHWRAHAAHADPAETM